MKFTLTKILLWFSVFFLCSASVANAGHFHKNKLAKIDAFHPPVEGGERNHLYKEWHYFTMSSENGDVTFSTIVTVEGDVHDNTKSYSLKIENYQTSVKNELTLDIFPIDAARWFDYKPDFYLDKNTISFDGHAYNIHTESADGQVIFDARWKPLIKPETPVALPMQSTLANDHVMNWLITAAELEVDGRLTVGKGTPSEKTYKFKKARGYHDHNWGYWDWSDNFGWDWGQAVERRNTACQEKKTWWKHHCKKQPRHAIALLNMTDAYDTETHSSVVKVWADQHKIKTFQGRDLEFKHKMMSVPELSGYHIPEVNYISAASGRDRLDITFRTQNYYPIYLPIEQGYRIIWELKGTFEVKGYLKGKKVNYITDGSMEYLGAPLLVE